MKDAELRLMLTDFGPNFVVRLAELWHGIKRQITKESHGPKMDLKKLLVNIKSRCNKSSHASYRYYGGRGIKCLLNINDLEYLWARDRGYKLKRPSIDRININRNYNLKNCRFIELSENIRLSKTDGRHIHASRICIPSWYCAGCLKKSLEDGKLKGKKENESYLKYYNRAKKDCFSTDKWWKGERWWKGYTRA